MVRQALHPEYYKPHLPGKQPGDEDELLGPSHISHCIDILRQAVMCNSDISPLVWQWDEKRSSYKEKATIMHTCKRFDKIQEWARGYAMYEMMDREHRVLNDPLDPESWVDEFSV